MNDEAKEILNAMVGRVVTDYNLSEEGLHFHMEDGRVVIFAGMFVIGMMEADEKVLH